AVLIVLSAVLPCRADGPADNDPEKVRRIPALGIEVPAAEREELTTLLSALEAAIDVLAKKDDPHIRELLPDVQIFHRAAHDALVYREFFSDQEPKTACQLLELGIERARQLAEGLVPWTTQTGLVVRGYVSKIDGSVQPYGLVVPESYEPRGAHRH